MMAHDPRTEAVKAAVKVVKVVNGEGGRPDCWQRRLVNNGMHRLVDGDGFSSGRGFSYSVASGRSR